MTSPSWSMWGWHILFVCIRQTDEVRWNDAYTDKDFEVHLAELKLKEMKKGIQEESEAEQYKEAGFPGLGVVVVDVTSQRPRWIKQALALVKARQQLVTPSP